MGIPKNIDVRLILSYRVGETQEIRDERNFIEAAICKAEDYVEKEKEKIIESIMELTGLEKDKIEFKVVPRYS